MKVSRRYFFFHAAAVLRLDIGFTYSSKVKRYFQRVYISGRRREGSDKGRDYGLMREGIVTGGHYGDAGEEGNGYYTVLMISEPAVLPVSTELNKTG